jgi:hypothetical protein
VSFPGVKRPWRGVKHPHPTIAEVKERVEYMTLLLYKSMLSIPRHHVLDYLKTLKMGHTSSTEMLVSDQKMTPGKNPKTVTRLEYSYSSTPSQGLYSLI